MLSTHQSAIREAPTVFSILPSLKAADKQCPQLQPSISLNHNILFFSCLLNSLNWLLQSEPDVIWQLELEGHGGDLGQGSYICSQHRRFPQWPEGFQNRPEINLNTFVTWLTHF